MVTRLAHGQQVAIAVETAQKIWIRLQAPSLVSWIVSLAQGEGRSHSQRYVTVKATIGE